MLDSLQRWPLTAPAVCNQVRVEEHIWMLSASSWASSMRVHACHPAGDRWGMGGEFGGGRGRGRGIEGPHRRPLREPDRWVPGGEDLGPLPGFPQPPRRPWDGIPPGPLIALPLSVLHVDEWACRMIQAWQMEILVQQCTLDV